MRTINDAKNFLRRNYSKGCDCPCCGQFVKLYKRKLNSGMARNLIRIHRESKDGKYIHVEDTLRRYKDHSGHDWALLRFWELIEEKPEHSESEKKNSGEWRLTYKGRQFVLSRIRVPMRILMYNNKFRGYDDNGTIDIVQALGNNFNYRELIES